MTTEGKVSPVTKISRRELLSYAWGAATALFVIEIGGVVIAFSMPRFKEGEFGGRFEAGTVDRFDEGSVTLFREGKFFLVRQGGERFIALYQVCTHLGCLVRWDEDNQAYRCPCHGGKFAKDGAYISGPPPRSMDRFAIEVVDVQVVVDTGQRTLGAPA
ncbi:MAG: Rieske 2Fe-2S domain-containing protein [Anaerolineae bacterium]